MDERVKTWPAPKGERASADYELRVNDQPVHVYVARVSAVPFNQVWPGYQRPLDQTELASFAYWDMAGPAAVRVRCAQPIAQVAVRPSAYGIRPTVQGDTITFAMERPAHVTVEVNGTHHALHLFASPPGEDVPPAGSVLYFGPGMHRPGLIELCSGQTVYIAGGAVVYGAIQGTEVSDVRILGRGILDVSGFARGEVPGAISLHGCTNATVEGIVVRDPNEWTIIPAACRGVRIADVKLIGLWRYNADGIDVVNSEGVRIENCFVRAFDDNIVIKGLRARKGYPTGDLPVRDVTVTGCVLWNDWGRALEVGAETCAPEISRLLFQDCQIIRTTHVALDVQHGDRATIQDIRFQNIDVEIDALSPTPQFQKAPGEQYSGAVDGSYCPRLLVLHVARNYYSKDEERGVIRDVLVQDVRVHGPHHPPSYLTGYDAEHGVEDVTIENLQIGGQPVRDAQEGRFTLNEYVRNVRFR